MKKTVKFGAIADLHVQLTATGERNVKEFLKVCREENVDFVVQLGDFCMPEGDRKLCADYSVNDRVLEMYNGFEKPSFHVFGNHDMDTRTKEEMLEYWGAKNDKPYYSFDMNEYHFVVLDPNFMKIGDEFISYGMGSYYAHSGSHAPEKPVLPYLPDEQLEWLKEDLAKTPYPTVLFSHQRLMEDENIICNHDAIRNYADLKKITDNAPNKVILSVNGHEHLDYVQKFGNTWYYSLNAVGMQWLGEDYPCPNRFTPEIDEQFPYVQYTIPYSKPLYAIITIDEDGITVKGNKGEFVGPGPEEMGVYEKFKHYIIARNYAEITASVEDRYLPIDK